MATKNIKHQTSTSEKSELSQKTEIQHPSITRQASAYHHMMQNPLGRKGWTIVWAQDEDIKKEKKSVGKTFKTNLPKRRIITVHLKGIMSCAVNPQNANSEIQYKIWINDLEKVTWNEKKSGSVSHPIDKSISIIIPKGGNTHLTFQIEALHAAVENGKATPLRIEKGFTITVTKIISIDQSLIIPKKTKKQKLN